MTDVSFADLVVRMVLSLGIVLGLVLGAYAVIRRRQGLGGRLARPNMLGRGGGARSSRGAATSTSLLGRGSKMPGARRGLRVVGRVGIGRTTQVVAVQFAEKVFLLGASEQSAPTILAELEMSAWLEATESPDDQGTGSGSTGFGALRERMTPRSSGAADGSAAPGRTGGPSTLLDALRDATVRRG